MLMPMYAHAILIPMLMHAHTPTSASCTHSTHAHAHASYDGKIREIRYKIGEFAKVGQPLLVLEVATDPAAMTPTTTTTATATATATPITAIPSQVMTNGQVLTSPAVRRLAKEENIDLSVVQPTGVWACACAWGMMHTDDTVS